MRAINKGTPAGPAAKAAAVADEFFGREPGRIAECLILWAWPGPEAG